MSGWAAAAQAAAEIADKLIDRGSASSAAAQSAKGRQFTIDMYERQLADQDKRRVKRIQEIVQDAKAAGVHPLYALGSSAGGGSPNIVLPGMPSGGVPSGGGGLAEGLRRAQSTLRTGKIDALQREAHEIAMERQRVALKQDELEYQVSASKAAREEQAVNAGPRMSEDGAITYPLAEAPSRAPLVDKTKTPRATVVEPHKNAPLWTTVERGGKRYRVLSEAVQADELNQILIAAQGTFEFFQNALTAMGFEPWEAGRQAYDFFRRMRRKSRGKTTKQRSQGPRRNW